MEVQNELQKLSLLFMTAQTNLRGYHLSEQDYYLEHYSAAVKEARKTLSRLEILTVDNPDQQADLQRMYPMIEKRIARWDEFLVMRKTQGLHAVQVGIRGEAGKNLDRDLSAAMEVMKQRETDLLKKRMSHAADSGIATQFVVFFGGLLAMILVGLAAWMVSRDMRRRELAEQELDRFFTTSLDMLCINGLDGRFKRLSPAFEDVLGYSLKELYKIPIIDMIHPDDRERTLAEIERQAQGESVLSFENRWRRKDGSYRYLSWKSVPIGDKMYAAARDVTEQKKFEMELVEAQIASQQAVKAKSEFLANMSHEIRTPLNGIIGMTEILRGTNLDSEQKRFTGIIQASGANLLKIINEILDLSKIEAGKLELENLDFELEFLAESQKSLIGSMATDKKLDLQIEVDPRAPKYLRGDSGRIGQILLNLLSNAIKFTAEGRVLLHVELKSISGKDCTLRFSVHDSGIGLKPELVEKLFNPFVQADGSTARKYGGTGLGLSICKRLAELLGGSIGVSSVYGQGSHFWVDIPLQISAPPKSSSPRVLEYADAMEAKKSLRVLVAEDNPVNQMIIEAMLRKFGHTVQTVGNGKEAVQAFGSASYDLILMDHHMPEMDGMEATALIRGQELGTGKRMPIIAFTANAMEEDQELCLAAGMDDVMVKPVTVEALEQTLSKWSSGGAGV